MFLRGFCFLALHLLVANGVTVVSPSLHLTVVAGRTFTVEWTNSGDNTEYNIDLFRAGAVGGARCGTFVTTLCDEGGLCADSSGDYDVVIPAPLHDMPRSGYVIGVRGEKDAAYGCSDEFRIVTQEEVPATNEYSLDVTAPVDGDVAIAGQEYTVQWKYLNAVGSATDRFDIDLFRATGKSGQCGTYAEALCDKSTIGCRDSDGEYFVHIPHDVAPGHYRIRVGRFEDESIFDCSGVFTVVDDQYENDMSFSMEFSFSTHYSFDLS